MAVAARIADLFELVDENHRRQRFVAEPADQPRMVSVSRNSLN